MIPSLRADGKTVVVTGGSKGLGRSMALGFAEAGANVVIASRKREECDKVAAEAENFGVRALAFECHVGDWNQCALLMSAAISEFGRLDVLVNNAGIAPVPPSIGGITEALFDKTIGVNLKGPVRLMGLAAEHMASGGSVINISSQASMRPTPSTVVYSAAKAALNAVTKAAAHELGPRGIRVNGIVCGTFHTASLHRSLVDQDSRDRTAQTITLRRIADADEIVGTALYLASGEASSYVTGALIDLDGGGM